MTDAVLLLTTDRTVTTYWLRRGERKLRERGVNRRLFGRKWNGTDMGLRKLKIKGGWRCAVGTNASLGPERGVVNIWKLLVSLFWF